MLQFFYNTRGGKVRALQNHNQFVFVYCVDAMKGVVKKPKPNFSFQTGVLFADNRSKSNLIFCFNDMDYSHYTMNKIIWWL